MGKCSMNRTFLSALCAAPLVLGLGLPDRAVLAKDPYSLRQYLNVRGALTPMISPSGEEVAFLTDITGVSQLWRVSSKGGWPDHLTFFPAGGAHARSSHAR